MPDPKNVSDDHEKLSQLCSSLHVAIVPCDPPTIASLFILHCYQLIFTFLNRIVEDAVPVNNSRAHCHRTSVQNNI